MKKFDVYTRPGCGYCSKAKGLLQAKGYAFTEHVVGVNATKEQIQTRANASGVNVQIQTVPQIFLLEGSSEKYIGGFDQLESQFNSGAI